MNFEIIRADLSLADDIINIENSCFDKPWSEKSVKSQLESEFKVTFLCRCNGICAGYISFTTVLDEGQIDLVAVAPRFRRIGVAKALFEAVFGYLEENGLKFLTLEVRASNLPAISLYEKLGFKRDGIRKKYYDGIEDAVLMSCERGERFGKSGEK